MYVQVRYVSILEVYSTGLPTKGRRAQVTLISKRKVGNPGKHAMLQRFRSKAVNCGTHGIQIMSRESVGFRAVALMIEFDIAGTTVK